VSDRLALANAIEDAGIPRDKAERVASVIFDAIHDNVATKADVSELRHDLQVTETRLKAEIAAVRFDLSLVEHRLLTRLGALMVVVAGLLFTALHYWPPGHGG
jgi:hypothetical protein